MLLIKPQCIWGCKIIICCVINIKVFTMHGDTLSYQISFQLLWWIHPIHKLQHNNIVQRPYTWTSAFDTPHPTSLKKNQQSLHTGYCFFEKIMPKYYCLLKCLWYDKMDFDWNFGTWNENMWRQFVSWGRFPRILTRVTCFILLSRFLVASTLKL